MKKLSEIFLKSPLARKQLIYILSISLFFTFISSVIQIVIQYDRDMKRLENKFEMIKNTHIRTMANSLWEMDTKLIKLHMDSILTISNIIFVETFDNENVISSGKIPKNEKTISKEYPLLYNYYGTDINIGTLKVTASLTELYSEVLKNAVIIFLVHSIEVFTVSLIILVVIYQFFIKNLIRISRYSKSISLDDLDSNSEISLTVKKSRKKDELEELAESLNNMKLRLKSELESKNTAEQKLKENEEFLRITLNSIIDGVITTNLEGKVVSLNPVARELTGFNPVSYDYGQKNLEEVFNIYNLSTGLKIPNPFKTAMRFGKSSDIFGKTLLKSKNDKEFIISYTAVPILDDSSEKKGVVIVFRDLTSIYEKELELIEKEKIYRIIFEQSNASIIIIDPESFKIIDCNRKTLDFFHISENGFKNISFTDFFKNEKDIPQFELINDNTTITFETELLSMTQKNLLCIVNLQTIELENKKRILALITDITSIKMMQEKIIESQKMDSIGNLAGGIAHNFNNKLAGILGYASMLEEMEDKITKKELIRKIIESAEKAAIITKNLLGFAKKGKNLIESCDLNILVEEVVSILKSGISPDKSIIFKLNLCDQIYFFDADPVQIKQALMNICLNSVEAIENEGEIYIETKNRDKNRIEISIKDTGKGIPEKIKSGIFEPFISTKNESDILKGRGLGLPAAYGIIKNHNGVIEYTSREGFGTLFKISFPKGFRQIRQSETKSDISSNADRTILIVEDEDILRTMLENILKNFRFSVFTAQNGKEGVEVFKNNKDKISAVILDMKMPVMNGKEAFLEMKKIDESVKVLISTGYGSNEEAQEILDLGAKELLTKPYHMKELVDKLKKLL
jgi:PAS domain S-box-containing protein